MRLFSGRVIGYDTVYERDAEGREGVSNVH